LYKRDKIVKELLNENESDSKPQDDNSLFGKVLLIDTENSNYQIFNKGHRNSIGLLVENSIILSTENGPRGGDEINLEIKGKNYGWDLAAYGKKYYQNKMYLDHESSSYQEPIFAFVPSLAVTEIIKLGNNFTNEWQDNYLIGTLNGRQLLRVKFSQDKSKVIYIEKIFIGERIRDLLYDEQSKTIILALEDTGSVGILYKD
jgi:glucose/arabinose dehydrogenase